MNLCTVVPEAPSAATDRVGRDTVSAVAGRLALFARLGAVVVDALAAVAGLAANRNK